jgi:hypothetical protein
MTQRTVRIYALNCVVPHTITNFNIYIYFYSHSTDNDAGTVSSTAASGPSGRPGTFQRDTKYSGKESGFLKLYDAQSGRGSHDQKVAAVNKIWSTPANKVSVTPSTCAGWKIRRALCYYERWYLDALIKGEGNKNARHIDDEWLCVVERLDSSHLFRSLYGRHLHNYLARFVPTVVYFLRSLQSSVKNNYLTRFI